jgi:hypothetical protein
MSQQHFWMEVAGGGSMCRRGIYALWPRLDSGAGPARGPSSRADDRAAGALPRPRVQARACKFLVQLRFLSESSALLPIPRHGAVTIASDFVLPPPRSLDHRATRVDV